MGLDPGDCQPTIEIFQKCFKDSYFSDTYTKSSFGFYGQVMMQTSGQDSANQTVTCQTQKVKCDFCDPRLLTLTGEPEPF